VRTKLTLAGLATAGLVGGGLSIITPAYATSGLPADCTFSQSGYSLALTCTNRPANQVWNLEVTCQITMGPRLNEPGNEVTGDGKSSISYCYKLVSGASFVIDS